MISGDLFDPHPMRKSAVLSEDSVYRYILVREWDESLPGVTFVMLNPSTADAMVDDATIRKCVGFARRWGRGRVEVVNLFAFRAREPAVMRAAADPIGPVNDATLESAAYRADKIIVAWGANGGFRARDVAVTQTLIRHARVPVECLRRTPSTDAPEHPLYIPYATTPIAWDMPEERS